MYNSAAVRAVREPNEWKSVPGYDGYEVSDTGLLRSDRRVKKGCGPRVLNGSATPAGYIQYKLSGDTKEDYRHVYAHELVLELWDKERPTNMWANHLDNDSGNNAIENLEWSTPLVANKNRDLPRGEDRPFSKLTEKQVRSLRLKRRAGVTYPALAEEYELAQDVIWRICAGRTWKHVDMEGLEVK